LLGSGQLPKRHGTAEYQNRKRGQPRRTLAGKNILLASMTQKMNGGRVQAIRYLQSECLPGARNMGARNLRARDLGMQHTTQLSIAIT